MTRSVLIGTIAICSLLWPSAVAQQTNPASVPPSTAQAPTSAANSGDTSNDVTAMPPSAAYTFAMQPVAVVRRSPDNMSDAERYAWIVAMARAAKACAAAKSETFNGEELYSLAQLCALGKEYPPAITAVKTYLASPDPEHPELARALWARTALQMADGRQAQRVTEQLIDMYPYDAVVHSVSQDVMLSLAGPDEGSAIALAMRRFPSLLEAIGSGKPLRSPSGDFEISTAALFRDALKLAAIYKHRDDAADAESVLQQIAARLQPVGSVIPEVEHHEIDVAVKHFLMLGQAATSIGYSRRLPKTRKYVPATLPTKGKATVLLFYTSWCAQCLKAMAALPKLPSRYGGKVAAYAVTTPAIFGVNAMDAARIESAIAENFKTETVGVPLLVANDEVRRALAIEDYPTLVIIGRDGRVQYLDELPHDGFQPRGYLDRMLRRLTGTPPPKEDSPERRPAEVRPPQSVHLHPGSRT